jgi:uncharacterized SAM-binding protein YcdF (DUF218 family)
MNDLLVAMGVSGWKPVLGTLVLPPIPFLLMALVGAYRLSRRRALGWTLLMSGLALMWLMCTGAVGDGLTKVLTNPPPALSAEQVSRLARQPRTVVLVLGGGLRHMAPEYRDADLKPMTLERLRYGAWLAKQTGLPLMVSGGVGHGAKSGQSEAEISRRVLERDFGMRLRWAEARSRDTQENANLSVALLRNEGIEHIVLVTHGFHQQRALANFQRAIVRAGVNIDVLPAPMGGKPSTPPVFGDFFPTAEGFAATRLALHEWLGRLAGA